MSATPWPILYKEPVRYARMYFASNWYYGLMIGSQVLIGVLVVIMGFTFDFRFFHVYMMVLVFGVILPAQYMYLIRKLILYIDGQVDKYGRRIVGLRPPVPPGPRSPPYPGRAVPAAPQVIAPPRPSRTPICNKCGHVIRQPPAYFVFDCNNCGSQLKAK
jgi:hypothetical protein